MPYITVVFFGLVTLPFLSHPRWYRFIASASQFFIFHTVQLPPVALRVLPSSVTVAVIPVATVPFIRWFTLQFSSFCLPSQFARCTVTQFYVMVIPRTVPLTIAI